MPDRHGDSMKPPRFITSPVRRCAARPMYAMIVVFADLALPSRCPTPWPPSRPVFVLQRGLLCFCPCRFHFWACLTAGCVPHIPSLLLGQGNAGHGLALRNTRPARRTEPFQGRCDPVGPAGLVHFLHLLSRAEQALGFAPCQLHAGSCAIPRRAEAACRGVRVLVPRAFLLGPTGRGQREVCLGFYLFTASAASL